MLLIVDEERDTYGQKVSTVGVSGARLSLVFREYDGHLVDPKAILPLWECSLTVLVST